ncbi:GNAT family N-acetyltransferase [Streptomyces swartbergensis]|uniref:Amino acid acetyltransferase n=1 Tax=Streptomyces swartbergensis TaxID=487165 RepID=A0A2C9ZNP5_9ACTN|nr:GNAT family N-acetyltransferase [Streptomyces swartbergensis]OUD04968.1 amino acid acetyltransferase [Streptomyces swartbergensis]
MNTVTPRPAPPLPRAPLTATSVVRPARPQDAAALAALSQPFVYSGELRRRPASLYAAHAPDFVVAEGPDGALEGCLALRVHAADTEGSRGPAGVLYNFCVARHRQGSGLGGRLLRAAVARARAQSVGSLFTATVGGGSLFLRHGFAPAGVRLAPAAWATSLDPRRNARILARTL